MLRLLSFPLHITNLTNVVPLIVTFDS